MPQAVKLRAQTVAKPSAKKVAVPREGIWRRLENKPKSLHHRTLSSNSSTSFGIFHEGKAAGFLGILVLSHGYPALKQEKNSVGLCLTGRSSELPCFIKLCTLA